MPGNATVASPASGAGDDAYNLKVVSDEVGALALDLGMTDTDAATVTTAANAIIAAPSGPGSAEICSRVADLSVDVVVVYGDAQGFAGDLDAFRDDIGLIRGDHAEEAAAFIQTVDANIDGINKDTATAYAQASQAARVVGCPGPQATPTSLPHADS